MMTSFKIAAVLLALSGLVAPLHAQPSIPDSTAISPDAWAYTVTKTIQASRPMGQDDLVYILNATGSDLGVISCGGHTLIAANTLVPSHGSLGDPVAIAKWAVTAISKDVFATSCPTGMEARSASGSYHMTWHGTAPGFQAPTFVIFLAEGV